MCGIAGILNQKNRQPIDEHLLHRMLSIIRHRGPDEAGIYIDAHVGLGHNRLSIIGLDDGTQPICNEDQTLWIIYNGEAFNYLELRENLIEKGHCVKTTTDTEVVLHLFEEYGPECLSKINGQFALAIWNTKNKELFLARDRVGIRPLFFWQNGEKLIFASEIKSIFMDPDVYRAIDLEGLSQVFTFWTTIGSKTIFQNVFELPPGHFMTVKDGKITQKAFWSMSYHAPEERRHNSIQEAREELNSLLKDAVRIRLRADVPVGAYLSGGLDSSITTALITKYFNSDLKTFSIGFEDSAFDESSYQKRMVAHLGTEHRQIVVSNEEIRDHFADVIWHCEKPLLRTAPVPLYLLSQLVNNSNLKVVLTGEGADEVFGGYNIFKEAKVRAFWSKHPESYLRPLLLGRLYPYLFKNISQNRAFLKKFFAVEANQLKDPFFSHSIRWSNTGRNKMFFSDEVTNALSDYQPLRRMSRLLPADFNRRDVLSKAQYLEMDIFLSNYLLSSQGDRMAMAHSLEIRLPFLDFRVIDFALRMPAKWKINGLNEKYILKRSFNHLVPDDIRKRPKQPYRAPIGGVFFGNKENEFLKDLISENKLNKAGLFDPQKVERLLSKFRKANTPVTNEVQSMAVVGILSTQLVFDQFIENFPREPADSFQADKVVRVG